jgi:hypothetical protein
MVYENAETFFILVMIRLSNNTGWGSRREKFQQKDENVVGDRFLFTALISTLFNSY